MGAIIERLAKRMSPLCILPCGDLVCYKDGCILVLRNSQIIKTIIIPICKKNLFLEKSRFLTRLLRLGVRTSIAINDSYIIYSLGNKLYELNLEKGVVSNGYSCDKGGRPLSLTIINGIDGFEDGVYYGGYLNNFDKKPVNIYKRTSIDKWEVVYTFPEGAINHVHAIIPDKYKKCIWVFTGDFDEAAAIWKMTDQFNKIERVACNNQKYRSCVAFPTPEGVVYATDTPFDDNYIFLLDEYGKEKKLLAIDGSCIYGCKCGNKLVFSSTVEPDGRNNTYKNLCYNYKRGAGIKNNYVHMYAGDLKDGFHEVYKLRKDFLPPIFQFACFHFPLGAYSGNTLYFQPIATCQNDCSLMKINLESIL